MAGSPRTYFRNWTSTDNTSESIGSVGGVVLTPTEVGFDAPSGKTFVEWNTARDGSGTSVIAGQTSYVDASLYAIWAATPAVEITYNGNTIATMSDTGAKTLLTADSYCENNIVVSYTTPAVPEPNLQTKTNITPRTYSQTITPDTGYDGLASVQINAIYPTKASATYTPTTSNQTITSGQWLDGNQTILGDANLVAGNIKKDVSIFSVVGTYEGGTPSYTLIASSEQTVATTQTYQGSVVKINFTNAISLKKWYLVRIRDKAGKRAGYFYGTDTMFAPYPGTASSTNNNAVRLTYHVNENSEISAFVGTSSSYVYGVYPTGIDSGYINIYKKYNSSFGTIDGTFAIEIYELDDPSGATPLE